MGAATASNGAVGFVRDDEIEIGGREEPLIFIVEEQGLDRRDDDVRPAPIIAVLFIDDRAEVVR
ncbi:hypothetical protein SDC9_208365 [bioreactor metagenome]|uniref:Uncharacterized protein n=1 Tax=bioreactor metagenome TaxID=1076179 RepID=A0A645JB41_9ZZZZ